MSSRRDRKSGTSSRGSSTPVAVFHGAMPLLFPVAESFIDKAEYRNHVKRLASHFSARAYVSLLTKLERLTHPRAGSAPTRRKPAVVCQRAYFSWDSAPRADYADDRRY